MSSDLRIWHPPADRPLPATLEEAGQAMLEFERLKPGLNSKFVELARAMRAHYPDNGDWPWGDPVASAQSCRDAVWTFTLPDEDMARAMRHLVREATALGLVVYGDQLGMAFLPNGRILPEQLASQWAEFEQHLDTAPPPLTKAQARKMMLIFVHEMVQRHGFVKLKRPRSDWYDAEFERPIDQGSQWISLRVGGRSPDFECELVFWHQYAPAEAIFKAFYPEEDRLETWFFNVSVFAGTSSRPMPIHNSGQIRALLELAEGSAIRLLDIAKTAEGLDRILNDPTTFRFAYADRYLESPHVPKTFSEKILNNTGGRLGLKALIIAWFVGNPRFEERAASYRDEYKNGEVTGAELERFLEYLRKVPR